MIILNCETGVFQIRAHGRYSPHNCQARLRCYGQSSFFIVQSAMAVINRVVASHFLIEKEYTSSLLVANIVVECIMGFVS